MKILGAVQKRMKEGYVPPYFIAHLCVGLGDKNQALAWLEKAYEDYSLGLFFVKVDPILDPLRPDPRFHGLLKRIGL